LKKTCDFGSLHWKSHWPNQKVWASATATLRNAYSQIAQLAEQAAVNR